MGWWRAMFLYYSSANPKLPGAEAAAIGKGARRKIFKGQSSRRYSRNPANECIGLLPTGELFRADSRPRWQVVIRSPSSKSGSHRNRIRWRCPADHTPSR